MAGEYGTDIKYDGEDIFASLEMQGSDVIVLESIVRRLQSNYGSLFYDREYGYNITSLLLSPILDIDSSLVENECLKDERVAGATCEIVNIDGSGQYEVRINVILSNSKTSFNLVFSLVNETVEVAYEKLS